MPLVIAGEAPAPPVPHPGHRRGGPHAEARRRLPRRRARAERRAHRRRVPPRASGAAVRPAPRPGPAPDAGGHPRRAPRRGAARARPRLHRARRPRRTRRRVHRARGRQPALAARHPARGRSQGGRRDPARRRRARVDPHPALRAALAPARRHDGHRRARSRGVPGVLRADDGGLSAATARASGVDEPDVVFTHRDAKMEALADEIARVHATGRPVLVGTASVAESEALFRALRDRRRQVPRPQRPPRRARGRDHRPGRHARAPSRSPPTWPAAAPTSCSAAATRRCASRLAALGGLYVIGTNRHESRRVDDQLRGRAGRQGDPGSSRFFISLEDDLISRYGVTALIPRSRRPARQRRAGRRPGRRPRDRTGAAHHRRPALRDPPHPLALLRDGRRAARANLRAPRRTAAGRIGADGVRGGRPGAPRLARHGPSAPGTSRGPRTGSRCSSSTGAGASTCGSSRTSGRASTSSVTAGVTRSRSSSGRSSAPSRR